MLPFLFLAAAIAAPDGYSQAKETGDCTLFTGPADDSGIAPMFTECHWPEVDPAYLQGLLGVWDAYDKYIFAIESCTILKTEGNRTLVHQVQSAPAISNREVAVWMQKTEVDGGFRFTWKDDPSVALTLAKGNIRSPKNEGYWQVTAHPESGAVVQHAVHYDPGGRVPSWLVRRFSIGGLSDVMRDVRAMAAAGSKSTEDPAP